MPLCPNCNKETGGSQFCPSCGMPQQLAAPQQAPPQQMIQPPPSQQPYQGLPAGSAPPVQPANQPVAPMAPMQPQYQPPPQQPQYQPPPQQYQPPPQQYMQPPPPPQPVPQQYAQAPTQPYVQQPPPQKKRSTAKIIGIVVACVVAVIVVSVVMLYVVLPMAGVNVTTGKLNIKYHSVWGGDVKIYIDDDLQGTYPADQYVTFDGISPGTHKVEVRDTSDGYLSSKTVEVTAGETTTVDLSYLSG